MLGRRAVSLEEMVTDIAREHLERNGLPWVEPCASGFDPGTRSWSVRTDAQSRGNGYTLVIDDETLQVLAVSHQPR